MGIAGVSGSRRYWELARWGAPWGQGSTRSSDTIANYTGSGLDEDLAVLVVGDVDSHLFVNGGFVCGVGGSECCGDVSQAGYQSSDVVFGESGGLFDAEKRLEAPA